MPSILYPYGVPVTLAKKGGGRDSNKGKGNGGIGPGGPGGGRGSGNSGGVGGGGNPGNRVEPIAPDELYGTDLIGWYDTTQQTHTNGANVQTIVNYGSGGSAYNIPRVSGTGITYRTSQTPTGEGILEFTSSDRFRDDSDLPWSGVTEGGVTVVARYTEASPVTLSSIFYGSATNNTEGIRMYNDGRLIAAYGPTACDFNQGSSVVDGNYHVLTIQWKENDASYGMKYYFNGEFVEEDLVVIGATDHPVYNILNYDLDHGFYFCEAECATVVKTEAEILGLHAHLKEKWGSI
jgi:hypothetical protein